MQFGSSKTLHDCVLANMQNNTSDSNLIGVLKMAGTNNTLAGLLATRLAEVCAMPGENNVTQVEKHGGTKKANNCHNSRQEHGTAHPQQLPRASR